VVRVFAYGAVTLYGRTFQTVPLTLAIPHCGPATPDSPCESPGLGFSDFARHYFRNHCCFLLLWVLRWFTSPRSLPAAMNSRQDDRCSHRPGFPIRTSPDHRMLASPRGLSQLATSFIAYSRQGIHTHALSSLTIKSTLDTATSSALPHPAHRWTRRVQLAFCPSIFNCQRSRLRLSNL
jgi:hypothetical protein